MTLTLASPVASGDDVTVAYVGPTQLNVTPIQDPAGNPAAAFTRTATNNTLEVITPTPDTTPPVPTGAEVNGAQLKITFDEPLDSDSLPDSGQFSVKVNGTSVDFAAANAVAISGSMVTLTLAGPVAFGDDVTVSYAVPTEIDAAPIQDPAGNPAATFTWTATNNTPDDTTPTSDDTIPPKPTGAKVDEVVLKITFDEPLDTNSLPDSGQFSVKVNGASVDLAAANAVAISGSVVTLTLASPVAFGDDVTVTYVPPTGANATPIQDLAGNDAATFTWTVTNDTPDTTGPVLVRAEVNGAELTLTYDETLNPDSVPDAGQFTVRVNGILVVLPAGAVTINGAVVTLTLPFAVSCHDDVTVTYTVPTGPDATPIRDTVGNSATGLTDEPVANRTPLSGGTDEPDGTDTDTTCPITTLELTIASAMDLDPIRDSLKVYSVTAREAISEPFRYVIEFLSVDSDNAHDPLGSDDALGQTATLEITVNDGGTNSAMSRKIHGIIDEFVVEQDPGADSSDRYSVVLVPRLASLARNRQNRIHATTAPQTLADIIRAKLLSQGTDYQSNSADTTADNDDGRIVIPADEFRIDIVDDDVPLHEFSHVAQYNETDLNFIRRLCESHGVHFFFASDADDDKGMVVFGNTNSPFGVIRFDSDPNNATPDTTGQTPGDNSDDTTDGGQSTPTTYPDKDKLVIELTLTGATGLVDGSEYTAAGNDTAASLEGALYAFTSVHRPGPGRVRVFADKASSETIADGQGIYTDYDTHFSNDTDDDDTDTPGSRFAAIRKQELWAANNYSIGLTNSPCIAPGRVFKMESTPGSTTGTHYLITEVAIDVRQAHTNVITDIDGETIETGIRNRFRCIEFDAASVDDVYRPPRVTPIPRLPGVYTAYITTGDQDGPMPDADGAYEVHNRFLDDRYLPADASPSTPVRKAEPYAGEDVGMHFPLKKDTEVLLAYRNGNPDRPVIAAAMPGPSDHRSPVTSLNPTSHIFHTSFGARFEVLDDYADERSRVSLRSLDRFEEASYFRLGKKDTPINGSTGSNTLEEHYVNDVFDKHNLDDVFSSSADIPAHDGIALLAADNIVEATKKNKVTLASENIHTRSLATHLLRGRRMVIFAGGPEDEPPGQANTGSGENTEDLDEKNLYISSVNDLYVKSHYNIFYSASGKSDIDVEDSANYIHHGDIDNKIYANAHHLVGGSYNEMTLGANSILASGLRTSMSIGSDVYIAGPLTGYLCFGIGAFMRPPITTNYMIVVTDTCEQFKLRHVPVVKESSAFSIGAQALKLRNFQLQSRIENWISDCVGISIDL